MRSMRAISASRPVARQAIGGDAEMQHAAGQRPRLVDLHLVAEPGQVIGGRQPARAGADDQDALAGGWRHGHRPAFLQSPCRRGSARPRGSTPRHPVRRGCRRFRTGDSRPARASPAAGCRPSASPTRGDTRLPAPAPARPGCSPRRGRRDCRAASARRSVAGGCGTARSRDEASDRPRGSGRARRDAVRWFSSMPRIWLFVR